MVVPPFTPARVALRRGLGLGLLTVLFLGVAALPSRLGGLLGHGGFGPNLMRALAGAVVDLAAMVLVLAPVVALFTVLLPLPVPRLRSGRWQRGGALWVSAPFGFVLWLTAVCAQEVKRERGSFPTLFDLQEAGSSTVFANGALGYIRYPRIAVPMVVGAVLAGLLLWAVRRAHVSPAPWRPWALGLLAGLALGATAVETTAWAQNRWSSALGGAGVGDPLTGLMESAFDLLAHRGPATARELVVEAGLPPEDGPKGATLLGWPNARASDEKGRCLPHPHARPLDTAGEPWSPDARGKQLLDALEQVSAGVFSAVGPKVAVFQLSLEGFRADDLHALHDAAPRELAPWMNGRYEASRAGPASGVLSGSGMFQAGVRTAHGLGAMTCGLGTLPYNLAFIRDLQPFPVRCSGDVLADAGFEGTFFYGSDASFDSMDAFFRAHGLSQVVSQAELPKNLPKGAWEAITDFAVFDEAATRTAAALEKSGKPQLSLVMSLSNHSPFTSPEDLPPEIRERVKQALGSAASKIEADDRLRLEAYSYTDAALERLMAKLQALGIADKSLVVLMADHSTGHDYLWGAGDRETDAAKSQIPFLVLLPEGVLSRTADPAALSAALAKAQKLIDEAPLSQNDLPAMLLALLSHHPALEALSPERRWHTLGGQVTSPYFSAGKDGYLLGINGVSQLYVLDREGHRVGDFEESVFLKTRADRYRVTPRLIPVTATLGETMAAPRTCSGLPPDSAPPSGTPSVPPPTR